MYDRYESPLITRYASVSMQQLFSAQRCAETWRRLWLALAKAEHELGLPITEEQIGCHIRYVSVGAERDAYLVR